MERYRTVSHHELLNSPRYSLNSSQDKALTERELADLIFSKEGGRDAFWSEISELSAVFDTEQYLRCFIASSVPLRPIIAVYHHVRRIYHPMSKQGRWTEAEDQCLIE